ncbi:hypothetical protein [Brevibacillus porteri]|uniref:hypothetical protein n=1 Tax=Brevibacillus porteri TaxID=2126350 RepID=UPI003D21F750
MQLAQIIQGNTIEVIPTLPERFFNCCVTSPPNWGLRDYGLPPKDWPEVTYEPMPGLPPITVPAWTGCLGLEPTPDMFIAHMVLVFREVRRLLRDDGTLWMNFGDSYFGTGGDRKDSANGPNSCVGATADAAMPREGRTARHKIGQERTKTKGSHWYPLESSICPSSRWLVITIGYHLE